MTCEEQAVFRWRRARVNASPWLLQGTERGRGIDACAVRATEEIPEKTATVGVPLDDVKVPMMENKGKTGEKGSRSAHYRDASFGTISFHDDTGERLQTISIRLHAAIVQTDTEAAAHVRGGPYQRMFLNKVTDHCLIDYWHALKDLEAISETLKEEAAAWFLKYQEILWEDCGGARKVIRSLLYLRKVCPEGIGKIKLLWPISHTRTPAVLPGLARNWPIRSDVVETVNKVLVTQRMKHSGMWWSHDGGQSVLAWRSLMQSGRFNAA